MSEDYTYEEPELITKTEHLGDGIYVDNQYIYLGEGVYALYRPEIISSEEGENSNPDNNIQKRDQENGDWYQNGYNYSE